MEKLTGKLNISEANSISYIGHNNTIINIDHIICSKCNKQKLSWHVSLPINSLSYCTCNANATKSDLEILQDEVKSLSKKIDKLYNQNK